MLCSRFQADLKSYKQLNSKGKPVNIDPLINSIIPNIKEKRKNELKFFFGFKTINK